MYSTAMDGQRLAGARLSVWDQAASCHNQRGMASIITTTTKVTTRDRHPTTVITIIIIIIVVIASSSSVQVTSI